MNLCRSAATLMNIIKGNLGTGILSFPIAFKYAGILGGSFLLVLVATIAIHCMNLLYSAGRRFSARCPFLFYSVVMCLYDCNVSECQGRIGSTDRYVCRYNIHGIEYDQVTQLAFQNGPQFLRKFSNFARYSMDLFTLELFQIFIPIFQFA